MVEFREQKDTKKDDGVWLNFFFKMTIKGRRKIFIKKNIIWESEKGKSSQHAGSDYYHKKKKKKKRKKKKKEKKRAALLLNSTFQLISLREKKIQLLKILIFKK